MHGEENYLELLRDVRLHGVKSKNRTGVDTFKVFGRLWECDNVDYAFPLLTTKRVHWKSIVAELLWFLSGSTNVNDLDASIWDEWADEATGELGPIYGEQWRAWPQECSGVVHHHDQIEKAVRLLRTDPDCRRIVVSAWNVADLDRMALQPCHYAFQLQHSDGELSMMVNMRSIDIFLGLPFNIASYALLLKMFAHVTGYRARRLCFSLGDLHLYENHIEQAHEQLKRPPYQSPIVTIKEPATCLESIQSAQISLDRYDHHPALKASVAV